jgi:hypothetical protein
LLSLFSFFLFGHGPDFTHGIQALPGCELVRDPTFQSITFSAKSHRSRGFVQVLEDILYPNRVITEQPHHPVTPGTKKSANQSGPMVVVHCQSVLFGRVLANIAYPALMSKNLVVVLEGQIEEPA